MNLSFKLMLCFAAFLLPYNSGYSADTNALAKPADYSSLLQASRKADQLYSNYLHAPQIAQKEKLWKEFTHVNDITLTNLTQLLQSSGRQVPPFELLEWALLNPRKSLLDSLLEEKCIELLRDHHSKAPALGRVCWGLTSSDPTNPAVFEFLNQVAERHPDRQMRAYATFALGSLTTSRAEHLAFFETAPEKIFTEILKKPRQSYLTNSPSYKRVLASAVEHFSKVVQKYADCSNFEAGPGLRQPMKTLGDEAKLRLYACQNLTVGNKAPALRGKDLNGKDLTLAQHAGNVVLLNFWASWCGPCMQMVPHEKKLQRDYGGKGFVLLGVNGDEDKQHALNAMKETGLDWPSFWNGGSQEGIVRDCQVSAWPTYYLIDKNGVIRYKGEGYGGKRTDEILDAYVAQLVNE
jgi:thiol-disulfide isomerase/thioredoxin